MKELDNRIDAWAEKVGIHSESTAMKQGLYTLSETQELLVALNNVEECLSTADSLIDSPYYSSEGYEEVCDHTQSAVEDVADAIGDIYVTLKNVAHFFDLTMEQCVEMSVKTIEDRANRGGGMENGVYVKPEEE